jgi:hypothetical protein
MKIIILLQSNLMVLYMIEILLKFRFKNKYQSLIYRQFDVNT